MDDIMKSFPGQPTKLEWVTSCCIITGFQVLLASSYDAPSLWLGEGWSSDQYGPVLVMTCKYMKST